MTAPASSAPSANDRFPKGSVEAGVYSTYTEGFQHSLVVLAMGETCWLISTDRGHHLRVEAATFEATRRQLAYYDRESIGRPPLPAIEMKPLSQHLPLSPLVWVLAVFAVYWTQGNRPGLTDNCLLDARRVFEHGEWWRISTSLWLHADIGHLVSNAANGFMIFSVVVTAFGLYAGWSLIAGSAIAGNLATVALHAGEDYRSIGASTAIFAALGLLTGRAVRLVCRTGHQRWRTMLTPLFAGLAILGLYGAGGMEVDVIAHAMGFTSGLLFGFAAGSLIRTAPNPLRTS